MAGRIELDRNWLLLNWHAFELSYTEPELNSSLFIRNHFICYIINFPLSGLPFKTWIPYVEHYLYFWLNNETKLKIFFFMTEPFVIAFFPFRLRHLQIRVLESINAASAKVQFRVQKKVISCHINTVQRMNH